MVVIKGLEKRLNNTKILKNVSFSLPKGYIMGLIGPNGAGKTTLLHVILGLYGADEGEVSVFGRYPHSDGSVRDDIGFVLSEELFNDNLTLIGNAKMYGRYYSSFSVDAFSGYCDRFGLRKTKKLSAHSRGEKLKFQLAFALSHSPKLLVLDEPTASFDPEFRELFRSLITDFISDGEHSVILSTHVTEDLDRIADYVTILDKGTVVLSMDRESLEDSCRLITAAESDVKLIPKEIIIGMEKGAFGTRLLVRHYSGADYHGLPADLPSIEEILYFSLAKKI